MVHDRARTIRGLLEQVAPRIRLGRKFSADPLDVGGHDGARPLKTGEFLLERLTPRVALLQTGDEVVHVAADGDGFHEVATFLVQAGEFPADGVFPL